MAQITKDSMYGAVAPDDFESMLQLDRYGARSTAFAARAFVSPRSRRWRCHEAATIGPIRGR